MHLAIVGGSDGGSSEALRPGARSRGGVTVVDADAPSSLISGVPDDVPGEMSDWKQLADRSIVDFDETGMQLRLETTACRSDAVRRTLVVSTRAGVVELVAYDKRRRRGSGPIALAGVVDTGVDDSVVERM